MSQPFPVEILSDDDDDVVEEQQNHHQHHEKQSFPSKKRRTQEEDEFASSNVDVVILDDDPTPIKKPNSTFLSTPSSSFVVPDTPMSSFNHFKSDNNISIVKCTSRFSDPDIRSLPTSVFEEQENVISGASGLICLESENESEGGIGKKYMKENEDVAPNFECGDKVESEGGLGWKYMKEDEDVDPDFGFDISSRDFGDKTESEGGTGRNYLEEDEDVASDFGVDVFSQDFGDKAVHNECFTKAGTSEVHNDAKEKEATAEQMGNAMKQRHKVVESDEQSNHRDVTKVKKRKTEEEKICLAEEKKRLAEEKKLKREQEKLERQAMKAEAAAARQLQKEQQNWEKGKFALKSIVAEIDAKVVELGSIGGHLLTRFAEKGISFQITSNPIERSILWKMSVPEQISELSSKEIPYMILVYEADEFCNLVINDSLMHHVSGVRSRYSSYTICYVTNKLMAYINKREQVQYKNHTNGNFWKRPPVEEVLSKLTTDFSRVHSRQCRDEAELADHVAGLTCSLANCQFRNKLTRLSINANGAIVPKDFIDRNLIKKSVWLKALVAIPKVQPRFAVAIGKKYPTMKSLLNVYMDPTKSVHEKELLLKDIPTEGLFGQESRRRVGEVCSKRVYRILMAQNGNIITDDVEHGADFFRTQQAM